MGKANFILKMVPIMRVLSKMEEQLAKDATFITMDVYIKEEFKTTRQLAMEHIMTHIKATFLRETGKMMYLLVMANKNSLMAHIIKGNF